uniref:Uncharacterized protein n=1 Tax=Oryza barthii TaxID=65489 RepID=A0A0D3HJF2_9ORYZ
MYGSLRDVQDDLLNDIRIHDYLKNALNDGQIRDERYYLISDEYLKNALRCRTVKLELNDATSFHESDWSGSGYGIYHNK